jgi:hypothetical protein
MPPTHGQTGSVEFRISVLEQVMAAHIAAGEEGAQYTGSFDMLQVPLTHI